MAKPSAKVSLRATVEQTAPELAFKPLIGTDEATIDDKGRILVAKKKRDRLGASFAIALGPIGCLVAYPEVVWQTKLREIFSGRMINQGMEQFSRLVLGLAEDDLKFDQQGRVVVPQKLRELAGLKRDVVLVGCGDRLEIWDRDEWAKYNRSPDTYGLDRSRAVERAYEKMTRTGG